MKTKQLTPLILVILGMAGESFSQYSPLQWYFGENAALTFLADGSTATQGNNNMLTWEGSTILCDNQGSVVFYANGQGLWESYNPTMIQELEGQNSATQASLIVPIPQETGSETYKYLVFSLRAVESPDPAPELSVCYVRVETTGGGQPYTVLPDSPQYIPGRPKMAEKLALTDDGNGGSWVVAHDAGGTYANTFYLYHITGEFTSISSTTEAISLLITHESTQSTGGNHSKIFQPERGQGQMKFNRDGTSLGLVIAGSCDFEIFSFNKTTGSLSNPPLFSKHVTYPGTQELSGYLYGCEFSPSGNYFYTSEGQQKDPESSFRMKHIYQWDISGTTLPSPYIIATDNNSTINYAYCAMQVGPNDKIYCVHFPTATKLSVINSPNFPYPDCNYDEDAVQIISYVRYGLPSYLIMDGASAPPAPWECTCNSTVTAQLSLPIDPSEGKAEITFSLNSGTIMANIVAIDIVNFEIIPEQLDCQDFCNIKTNQMGMFIDPVPSLYSTPGMLMPLQSWNNTATNSHEVIWDLRNDPHLIIDQQVKMTVSFPKMHDLDCCPVEEIHYYATFRISFFDENCQVCQKVVFWQN